MARVVAPTKVTGGGGFEFEDKVAAFYMCYLLAERVPLDPSFGIIKRIDFQTRADGWLLDDLLLTLRSNDEERHCAFSIKSNPQFSKTSAPSDFVRDAWEQYLGEKGNPFNRNKDRIGLITSPIDTNTKIKVEDLLKKAREQEPHDFALKVMVKGYISKEGKSIFESFQCPHDLAQKHSVDENNIGEMLKCIDHLEFDFGHTSSSKVSEAISLLRGVLESNSLDEAKNLWETFCTIARETRSKGGYIDLSVLIGKIRTRYRLKDFPDHSAIWEKIKRKTKYELELIRDKIADAVSIERDSVISKINEIFNKKDIVILLGESGSGKTVIEKTIAKSKLDSCKIVWISTENLSFLDDLLSLEIVKVIPDKTAFLIIDGLDRFYDDNDFRKIALLLKACHHDSENSLWKIIISCQPEEWTRVQINFSKLNVSADWEILDVKNPSSEGLEPVWQKYPSLRSLSFHPHLKQFIFKPKVLDLIAKRISTGGVVDPQGWIGESSLISWYWKEEIEAKPNGLIRGVILKKVAEKLANNLVVELPAADFSADELSVIQELIRDRILKERNNRISFEHDLVADWTRQRILLEKYPNVFEYTKDRLTSPIWCKALRLLGIHLLETETDLQKWKSIFDSFGSEKDQGNLGQDLLLEAAIFSANPSDNLEKQWIELQKNDGVLLCRLLNRFLYSATFPNKIALLIASQYKDEATAEIIARYRDPYWLYWVPAIKFLYNHRSDTIQFSKKQVAEIVDKWLRFSEKDWPARYEAAEIGIEIAEDMLALKMSAIRYFDRTGLVKLAFRAGLAACNEQPDRVLDFALTACSRKDPSVRILELIAKYNEEAISHEKEVKQQRIEIPEVLLSSMFESETPSPWPNGPKDEVDRDFHELCLESGTDTDALYPLILSHPEKAREIILALLIEHPTPRDRHDSRLEKYTGMTSVHRWFPPFYTRGPFYFFLNTHPEKGLDLIISLINFATERWAGQWTNEGKESPYIEIEFSWGKKRYTGDAHVYYWHRDVGCVSKIIPSALMALEKWLYDRLEKEEYKEEAIKLIEEILKKGASLAFTGLLISTGKKHKELFSGVLLSLLAIPEFYSWDVEHILKSEDHQMIGWFDHGKDMMRLAQEFNSMPHRKLQLNQIAINLFLNNENVQMKFEKFRKVWKSRFEKSEFETVSSDTLENLIQWFDISNWGIKEVSGQGKIFEFKMPKEITERRQEGFKESQDRQLLLHLPIKFRGILDGNDKLSSDDAEKVWNTIQFVSNITVAKDDPDRDIFNKDNAICGGIAVLFKHFKDWLEKEPDKKKWCVEKVTGMILNPPQDRPFDSEVGIGSWIWDRFCAEVMPIIWTDDQENSLFRKCIAILTINKHYETVSILFKSASEHRTTLKEHFRQLINFLLKLSHARWKFYKEQHLEKKTSDINKWLEKEINAFEKGKTPSDPITWEIIAQEEIKKRNKLHEKEIKKRVGNWKPPKEEYFDLWLIKAAFDWMPPLKQAVDRNERKEWLSFWKQVLSWTLNILETDDDGEISGVPSEWDRWLLERIVIQVLCMDDSERPDELWRPILNLGGEGHYWVDDFLTEWFMKGIGAENVSDNFTKRWKEMLEYAFRSEKWNPSSGYRRYYLNKLWCELLGMNYIISNLWKEDKKFVIKEMKQYYERWANSSLTNTDSAAMFINFLMCPAVEEILFEGLTWLDKASKEAGDKFFSDRHNNTQKHLADLLEVYWKKHREKIKGNSAAYDAFKNLLRKLVDMQNIQAIELQQSLI
ncbi:MAG: hypothetical protein Q6358_03365 [Candidatus Brocadiales bacterium]|nr:hypothetical protein [Candidatus Brocadiales bacterium]